MSDEKDYGLREIVIDVPPDAKVHYCTIEEAREAAARFVTVPRKLLEEALEQIEATWVTRMPFAYCEACGIDLNHGGEGCDHKPDCRYVRIRDALKGLVGK